MYPLVHQTHDNIGSSQWNYRRVILKSDALTDIALLSHGNDG